MVKLSLKKCCDFMDRSYVIKNVDVNHIGENIKPGKEGIL